ncbi:MAG: hypothetical protein PHU85_03905 [Phycisphaerae bacterium]|nr:hypothetical protein [Phycisphaerae bacterium]
MPFAFHLSAMDAVFFAVMTVQATAIAYLHSPRWKVIAFSLPLPFTFASLSLGQPIGVTHIAGVILIPAFAHGITWLHYRLRVPIIPAIAAVALGYCAVGVVAAPRLPNTSLAFAITAGLALAVAVALALADRHHHEPGHRSPMPVPIKLLVVGGIVVGLVLSKRFLGGFMALYPIMGTLTGYEARHSLRSFCRQTPTVVFAIVPMIIAIRLLQSHVGLAWSLPVGWAIFLSILIPLSWRMWFASGATGEVSGVAN